MHVMQNMAAAVMRAIELKYLLMFGLRNSGCSITSACDLSLVDINSCRFGCTVQAPEIEVV
jgi:hypothetical protein